MKPESVEDQYVIRLFRRDRDFAGLVQLRADIEAVDQAGNDLNEAAVSETLNWPGHDPQKDRWVVESPEDPGRFVGHAWARSQSQERTIVYVAIHPEWRRNGLGSALLERAFVRAHEHGASHVTVAADIKNAGAREFLLHRDFEHAGNNRFMQAPAGIPLAQPHWPAGYTVRNYADVQELSVLVEAFNRSYGDMWGHRENTQGAMNEDYLAKRMEQSPERYIPEGIFIVFGPDGDIAGVCMGIRDEEQTKTVDAPGVVPEHRQMRLQRPLALTVMHWLRGYGSGPLDLESYGDQEDTIEIYREVGFVLQEHYAEYRRYLR